MQKFDRLKKVLWIFLLAVVAIIIVTFLMYMTFPGGLRDRQAENNLAEKVEEIELSGQVTFQDENKITLLVSGGLSQDLVLADQVVFQVRNPMTNDYTNLDTGYDLTGLYVFVETSYNGQTYTANKVKAEQATTVSGRVVSVGESSFQIEDYTGAVYEVLVTEHTSYFMAGSTERFSLANVAIDDNVVATSALLLSTDNKVAADWVEIIDSSLFVTE
ncbi:MAG: hypothetical protein WC570_00920 [Patescibacteria group bacterium]